MKPMRPLLAAALATISAQAIAAEDLISIYRDALQSDPVFQQARANLQAEQERVPQARAQLLPNVSAQAGYEWVDQSFEADAATAGRDGDEQFDTITYGVNLTQPIFRYSAFKRLDQAQATVAQATARFAAAEQALMMRVSEAYFQVLDARVALAAAQAQLKAIARQRDQARQRFEVGLIARTAVVEAQAAYDQARAAVIAAENALQSARERVREITGELPAALATVREEIPLTLPQPADLDAWRQIAAEQNWTLIAATKAAEAAMINIDAARGTRYPDIDAVAGYNHEDSDGGIRAGETDQFSVGVQLSVPLYLGGSISSQVDEAQYRYTEAREVLQEVRRNATSSAADAYRGVETALQRVRALEQAVESARSALEATSAGFDVGTRTIVDVLDAQQVLFAAQRDYRQARHAYLVNTLRLKQAAGKLSVADLKAVNSLLEEPQQ